MSINMRLASAVCAWAVGISSAACALPVLDAKDAAVRITTPDAATMNIDSTARNNVIRWVDFSVAGGKKPETVRFDGNNYLNYVKGNARSEIFGTLTGGGNIFIVNPHGILIGDGAKVSVGNLYLSTRVLSDGQLADFSAHGTSPFQYAGDAIGDVVNLGHLNATSITVEGNVIKFKNVQDVNAETINVSAKTETRVGYEAGVNPSDYASLNTAKWYELIMDENGLQNMQLNKDYMLARDMEVTGEFTAIGTNIGADNKYLGHFDGLEYGIEFASVKANGKVSGLFGAIGVGSVVENVSVKSAQIQAIDVNALDTVYIGGVVGYSNQGTIRNVQYTGEINAGNPCAFQYVGGIVGYNNGGVVENACNTGTVSASGTSIAYVGGIVGYNNAFDRYNSVTQKNDFFEAAIKSSCNMGKMKNGTCVGGVVGGNHLGRLENVYNIGIITGKKAGGIIGKNDGKPSGKETVCYAYHAGGTIDGTLKEGGIVADDSNGIFSHVFYEAATMEAEPNSLSEKARSVAQLKSAQMFIDDGWDISAEGGVGKTWRIYDGNSTPLLTAFLKPKDNISIVDADGSKAPGAYWDTPSKLFSPQLTAYQKGDQTYYKKGYDYVSDVICVLLKQDATGTTPVTPPTPSNPAKPSGAMKPSDAVKLSDNVKSADGESIATGDPISREYGNELAALHHLEKDERREASAESGTAKPVIVGIGVRLPDDFMSVEEVAAMLSDSETRENAES